MAEAAQAVLGQLISEPYDSLHQAPRFEAPFAILRGTEDELIPVGNVLNLYALVPQPKQRVWIKGGTHCDLLERSDAAEITRFLDIVS